MNEVRETIFLNYIKRNMPGPVKQEQSDLAHAVIFTGLSDMKQEDEYARYYADDIKELVEMFEYNVKDGDLDAFLTALAFRLAFSPEAEWGGVSKIVQGLSFERAFHFYFRLFLFRTMMGESAKDAVSNFIKKGAFILAGTPMFGKLIEPVQELMVGAGNTTVPKHLDTVKFIYDYYFFVGSQEISQLKKDKVLNRLANFKERRRSTGRRLCMALQKIFNDLKRSNDENKVAEDELSANFVSEMTKFVGELCETKEAVRPKLVMAAGFNSQDTSGDNCAAVAKHKWELMLCQIGRYLNSVKLFTFAHVKLPDFSLDEAVQGKPETSNRHSLHWIKRFAKAIDEVKNAGQSENNSTNNAQPINLPTVDIGLNFDWKSITDESKEKNPDQEKEQNP